MRVYILLTVVAGLLIAADAPQENTTKKDEDTTKKDIEKLQGTWREVAFESNGNQFSEESLKDEKWTVSGDTIIWSKQKDKFIYKLGAAATPKTIDLIDPDDREFGTRQGIYLLEGDNLKICYAYPDKKRPTEFTTKKGSFDEMFTFKRMKP